MGKLGIGYFWRHCRRWVGWGTWADVLGQYRRSCGEAGHWVPPEVLLKVG